MKAALAYFQGKFNSHQAEQLSETEFKITLGDSENELQGSFVAIYNEDGEMIDTRDDTEMQPAKRISLPLNPIKAEKNVKKE
jgi:hypothetical protein